MLNKKHVNWFMELKWFIFTRWIVNKPSLLDVQFLNPCSSSKSLCCSSLSSKAFVVTFNKLIRLYFKATFLSSSFKACTRFPIIWYSNKLSCWLASSSLLPALPPTVCTFMICSAFPAALLFSNFWIRSVTSYWVILFYFSIWPVFLFFLSHYFSRVWRGSKNMLSILLVILFLSRSIILSLRSELNYLYICLWMKSKLRSRNALWIRGYWSPLLPLRSLSLLRAIPNLFVIVIRVCCSLVSVV